MRCRISLQLGVLGRAVRERGSVKHIPRQQLAHHHDESKHENGTEGCEQHEQNDVAHQSLTDLELTCHSRRSQRWPRQPAHAAIGAAASGAGFSAAAFGAASLGAAGIGAAGFGAAGIGAAGIGAASLGAAGIGTTAIGTAGRREVRCKPTIALAYSHKNTAMTLPPGNDSTSGSKPPPMLWSRAAIRPALDSIKFNISISYIVGNRAVAEAA